MSDFLVDHVKDVLASSYVFLKRSESKRIIRWMGCISVREGGTFLYLCGYAHWLYECVLHILSRRTAGSNKLSDL